MSCDETETGGLSNDSYSGHTILTNHLFVDKEQWLASRARSIQQLLTSAVRLLTTGKVKILFQNQSQDIIVVCSTIIFQGLISRRFAFENSNYYLVSMTFCC